MRTFDLVDIINDRRRKSYLDEALSLTYQEMTGCDDIEPDVLRTLRLRAEADLLLTADDNPPVLDF